MDWPGALDSECESIDKAADGHRTPVDDQMYSDKEAALLSGNANSDARTRGSRPADEGQTMDGFVSRMSVQGSLGSSAAKAKREDDELGCSGETTHHRSVMEEKLPYDASSNSGRFQPSEGGGLVFDGEEQPPPSTAVYINSIVGPDGERDTTGSHSDGSMAAIANSNVASVDKIIGASEGKAEASEDRTEAAEDRTEARRQKREDSLRDLAERLSEPLGMAVATVFYEVFEQDGFFGTSPSPVDELSQLLGAALKESLFCALGNDRTAFVKKFRSSFKCTYSTMRSVRRAYVKTGGKLNRSRQQYPKSWRGSPSNLWRVSPSKAHRGPARRSVEGTHGTETRTHPKFRDPEMTRTKPVRSHLNYPVQSVSEEEITTCTSARCRQRREHSHALSSGGKSCLSENLQSFSDNGFEQDVHDDTAGSCSKSCRSASLESSFFTFSNLEQGGRSGSARSSSSNSVNASMEFPLAQPTPDARDVKSELLDTEEDSTEDDMFSAMSRTDSQEWMMLDRDDCISEALGLNQGLLSGSSDKSTFLQDEKYGGRRVENQGHPPLTVGTDTPESSSGLGNQTPRSLHPGLSVTVAGDSFNRVTVNSPMDHPGDNLLQARSSQVMSFVASSAVRERSCPTAEPSMNMEGALRRGADSFRRADVSQGGIDGNILIHRRPGQVWEDVTDLTGPSLEDVVRVGAFPFLDSRGIGGREALLQRYVEAKEAQNHLRSLKLAHSIRHLSVKEDHLQLHSESNILMRENVDLSRSKVSLKEFELEDRKLTAAHHELSRMCADELVAGLFVMLVALVYGTWKFSYTRLSRVMTMCQIPERGPRETGWLGLNWMYNTVDTVAWQLQALTCELTKAGRMLLGLVIIAFVASSLLRRIGTSSSQAMPATIILVVLAGVCGIAGKISIDSLGGDGFCWVLLWELLCSLHAFATCFTPWLYKYLYGPSTKFYQGNTSFWLKLCSVCARFVFHTFLGFALPVLAGLLPFASLKELNEVFWEFWKADAEIGPF